jgi:lipid-A-disaccharide synthase
VKYFIIAGEASGDLHGSNLIKEIKRRIPETEFRGIGGDRMIAEGLDVLFHIRQTAFMGFIEVISNLRKILSLLKQTKQALVNFNADALILIDYPGFNLEMAKFAHSKGIRVFYYISPQLWAWKKNRIKIIEKAVTKLFVILPFEVDFYAANGLKEKVIFVGHPLLDAIDESKKNPHPLVLSSQKPVLAILPGSRKQEIRRMLPVMLQAAHHFSAYFEILVAGAPTLSADFYMPFLENTTAKLIHNQTYEILKIAKLAAVTSGTATLETGLWGVPLVVCYKANWLSYQIAKRIVDVKYISLVNLILNKPAVTELIQSQMNVQQLTNALNILINDNERYIKMKNDLQLLHQYLGGTGASARTAEQILALTNHNSLH